MPFCIVAEQASNIVLYCKTLTWELFVKNTTFELADVELWRVILLHDQMELSIL